MFPKLKDCGGFEVLRSLGPKEVLRLVSSPRTGYSVPFFRDIRFGEGFSLHKANSARFIFDSSETNGLLPGKLNFFYLLM